MPMPIAAKAGVIALSVAVAAAIAVYESPELRRMADDLRRRIAIALHSMGDGVQPPAREPRFNRPEDADGFLQSRAVVANEPGVDADDETRRRQREELMYWNAVLEEKKTKERGEVGPTHTSPPAHSRASSFDDFLQRDSSAEQGTYVFNTGAQVRDDNVGLLRRRGGVEGVRGLNASIYANPFADENGVDDFDDQLATEPHPLSPGKDETMSVDIYNATEAAASQTLSPQPVPEVLFDYDAGLPTQDEPEPATLMDRELAQDEFMTAGQEDRYDAYASVQAWANNYNNNFNPGSYSPLPMSPPAPLSEPDIVSEGALTPADSASLAGSGEDIGDDAASSRAGENGRYYDVISEDEDGMPTPVSWTEVGSVVSESESAVHA
ncbi:hypothetical protein QBC33DRAFT_523395 [Phialemonium atrogriseum]|uniref:Uncharacterized protein n=1 Tax=Phialemonium atrogriseum TaxID=1093897 RepID=A0AAJ0C9D9_9PEZI|nr:uncharacterized protein QBC33DRAFT_523395 [Phialemonium atrogriseum]KAK1771348.1 hypothetical protein QBC33DRAFT_523395 [Phialemonium atrogriseum]